MSDEVGVFGFNLDVVEPDIVCIRFHSSIGHLLHGPQTLFQVRQKSVGFAEPVGLGFLDGAIMLKKHESAHGWADRVLLYPMPEASAGTLFGTRLPQSAQVEA